MRRWFLSYHSADEALAERFKAAIERKDAGSRVFFAATSLRAGGYWQPALAKEIDEADAFVLLVGEKGLGPWQALEYYAAHDRHVKSPEFPAVLVLLDGHAAPGLPFLRQLHWIVSADPASEKDVARLVEAAAGAEAQPGELWRYTSPYRGLSAMEEKDADYFFGREGETVAVLGALAAENDRMPVLLGNSGVGKSSLAQAGVIAALRRQAWPERASAPGAWPAAFNESRGWCFFSLKPGTEPVRALVETFLRVWQLDPTRPAWGERRAEWIAALRAGKSSLRDLLDATERRFEELRQTPPPAFLLYIDQGEELYVRSEEGQRRRFSEILAKGVADPRLHTLMTLRADFFGELHKDEPLYKVHRLINVPPLREAELREVVSRPASMLSVRFETNHLAVDIARRTAEESTRDAGALPLLSYLLDDMWTQMVARGDGVLRLPTAAFELGGVLAERAKSFLSHHPQSGDALRRLLTLKLATVREDGVPTRRRARRSEFSDGEWRLVSELADDPYRLLVTATPEGGETYAEVAHEAIFRRWEKLSGWIAQEREFLIWKSALEASRRGYEAAPANAKAEAVLMGLALTQASNWLARRSEDIPTADRGFIVLSRKATQRRSLRVQALVGVLVATIVAGVTAWWNDQWIKESIYWLTDVRAYVLTAERERTLGPKTIFKECTTCPEMVVVRAGEFMMGSPDDEKGRDSDESPQHKVTIARPFAVGRVELTFDEWDTCVAHGDCPRDISASGWGRGRQPVISVSWDYAKRYVAWLSRITGKPYRLLSEAEWEYAARAGTATRYSFGDDEAALGQYAWYTANSDSRTHPAGEKTPNAFDLYDMHGNAWEWVEDCVNDNYNGAPADGAAWTTGDCGRRVLRGGSWVSAPEYLRAAVRLWHPAAVRFDYVGFRMGRTLSP